MNENEHTRSPVPEIHFPETTALQDLWKPDPADYREYLDAFDLSEEEEIQLLEALACIVQHFIEMDEPYS